MNGLGFCHSNEIIYCDLRPSTVLLNEYSKLKLADFGFSRKTTDFINTSKDALGKQGSPYYMAPELFLEGGVYSFASDLWSFGCILYEFVTGRPPFYSTSLKELIRMIQEEPLSM